MDQKQSYPTGNEQHFSGKQPVPGTAEGMKEVAPGTPIIRDNTPRPLTWSSMMGVVGQSGQTSSMNVVPRDEYVPAFPAKAPSAPPLPEELTDELEQEEGRDIEADDITLSLATRSKERRLAAQAGIQPLLQPVAPLEYGAAALTKLKDLADEQAEEQEATGERAELITEPVRVVQEEPAAVLPLVAGSPGAQITSGLQPEAQQGEHGVQQRWLIGFSIYLVALLLIVLAFAVLQGVGGAQELLTSNVLLLDVPWLVLVYGLLGGCVSSIVSLGRLKSKNPPNFVIITWFTRPFIGAVLALFTYLLFNSGIFALAGAGEHQMLFLLAGALAGMCECWFFAYTERS